MTGENRGRWKRFSLRTLLAVITVSCVFLGTWSAYVNPFRHQARSLAEVYRLQGVSTIEPAIGPAWHRWLVTTLLGEDAFVRVTKVDLSGRQIDDDALLSLTGLTHLTELYLDGTALTDASTSAFRSMPELRTLSLKYTGVSDAGVEAFSTLPNLRSLILTGTKLSDAAVLHFAKMPRLSELYVRWTRLSDSGARKLADALPNCKIIHHALIDSVTITPLQ
jgi:hypothetical protein